MVEDEEEEKKRERNINCRDAAAADASYYIDHYIPFCVRRVFLCIGVA